MVELLVYIKEHLVPQSALRIALARHMMLRRAAYATEIDESAIKRFFQLLVTIDADLNGNIELDEFYRALNVNPNPFFEAMFDQMDVVESDGVLDYEGARRVFEVNAFDVPPEHNFNKFCADNEVYDNYGFSLMANELVQPPNVDRYLLTEGKQA